MASSKEMREQWEREKRGSPKIVPNTAAARGGAPARRPAPRDDDEYVELDQIGSRKNNPPQSVDDDDDLGLEMVDRNSSRSPQRPTVKVPPRDASLAGRMGARNDGSMALRGAAAGPSQPTILPSGRTSLPPSQRIQPRQFPGDKPRQPARSMDDDDDDIPARPASPSSRAPSPAPSQPLRSSAAPQRLRPAERAAAASGALERSSSSPPPRGAGGFIPQVLKRVVSERRDDSRDEPETGYVSRRKQMLAAERQAALPTLGTSDCVFCRRSAPPIKTSTHFYVQWDTKPAAKGHALVIPFRHITSYFELSTEEAGELHALIKSTKTQIDSMYRPDGYNIGVNEGEWAGQTIPHLHIHILPRYKGDVAAPVGGMRRILTR